MAVAASGPNTEILDFDWFISSRIFPILRSAGKTGNKNIGPIFHQHRSHAESISSKLWASQPIVKMKGRTQHGICHGNATFCDFYILSKDDHGLGTQFKGIVYYGLVAGKWREVRVVWCG